MYFQRWVMRIQLLALHRATSIELKLVCYSLLLFGFFLLSFCFGGFLALPPARFAHILWFATVVNGERLGDDDSMRLPSVCPRKGPCRSKIRAILHITLNLQPFQTVCCFCNRCISLDNFIIKQFSCNDAILIEWIGMTLKWNRWGEITMCRNNGRFFWLVLLFHRRTFNQIPA